MFVVRNFNCLGLTQLNDQSKHQKRSRNTPGWLNQDYSAIVMVFSAIHRRRVPFPTPDESPMNRDRQAGNYNLKCISLVAL